jgi:DNA polymerase-1
VTPLTVFLDTETTGTNPRKDRLVAVGFALGEHPPRALLHDRDRELIQRVLSLEDALFVGHNVGFDMHFLEAHGYRLPDPARWEDTMLLAYVNGTNGERMRGNIALAKLTKRLIEAGELPDTILAPEAEIKRWRRAARAAATREGRRPPELGDAPEVLLRPYLAADVFETRAVHAHYVRAGDQHELLELERALAPVIYAAEQRGAPIDVQAAREVCTTSAAKLVELRNHLFELAGKPFLLNSAPQIEQALRARGVDLSRAQRTRTDKLAISADALELIDDELTATLLEHRAERVFHDLLDRLVKFTVDGRVYTSFRQNGAETGRMSSGQPNLQNIPASDLRARYTICAGPGRMLVGCDMDNIELRVLAHYAAGGELERALQEGDLHQRTADGFGIDRATAKTLNYGILYGAGADRVGKILGLEHAEAKRARDQWYRLWPEIGRLKRRLKRQIRRYGYIETLAGRRHYAENADHRTLNYLIQGSAADLFKCAAIELHALGVPMIMFIHDEIVAEVPQAEAGFTARLLEEALARGMGRVEHLVAKAQVADRWSDFKEPGWAPEPRAA